MKEYSYIAAKKDGSQTKGVYKAENTNAVIDYLHSNGLIVVSIQESVGIDLRKIGDIQIGGLPLKEKMIIAKQLTTMIGAGVPLIQALEILISQSKNKTIKSDLQKVYEGVQGGSSLSQAFQRYSHIFDELQINLIQAGEKSGNLAEVMAQIAVDLEKRNSLMGKIRGAMIYPVIIFVVMIAVIFVMVVYMIPAVQKLYEDFGVQQLPAITRMFVNLSDYLTNPIGGISTIVAILGIIIGVRLYYSSISGKRTIDKILLKVPIFGQVFEYSQVVQFTRLLAMLLKSGISIIDALRIVSTSLGNIHFREALSDAVVDVSKGSALAASLSKSEVIPQIVNKMIAIGEETGSVDKMLTDMSNFYENELNSLTDNLTKLMEPAILLIVGVLVGILAVAIYLPIYQIAQF